MTVLCPSYWILPGRKKLLNWCNQYSCLLGQISSASGMTYHVISQCCTYSSPSGFGACLKLYGYIYYLLEWVSYWSQDHSVSHQHPSQSVDWLNTMGVKTDLTLMFFQPCLFCSFILFYCVYSNELFFLAVIIVGLQSYRENRAAAQPITSLYRRNSPTRPPSLSCMPLSSLFIFHRWITAIYSQVSFSWAIAGVDGGWGCPRLASLVFHLAII